MEIGHKGTDDSYITGEGVELTVHKDSVVVEEIKEVELRSRRAQSVYDRNYNSLRKQPTFRDATIGFPAK